MINKKLGCILYAYPSLTTPEQSFELLGASMGL